MWANLHSSWSLLVYRVKLSHDCQTRPQCESPYFHGLWYFYLKCQKVHCYLGQSHMPLRSTESDDYCNCWNWRMTQQFMGTCNARPQKNINLNGNPKFQRLQFTRSIYLLGFRKSHYIWTIFHRSIFHLSKHEKFPRTCLHIHQCSKGIIFSFGILGYLHL